MAIRAMWGFSHLPQKGAVGVLETGFGLKYNGYGINAPNSYGTIWIDGNSIYMAPSSNIGISFSVPVSAITDMVSPKSIIGFRFRTTNLYYGVNIVVAGVATNVSELGVPNAGEVYIEVVCDRVTKDLSYFVNGVFKLKKTAAVVPMIAGQTLSFSTAPWASINGYLSDFYFIDDTQDDTPCTRLGSVSVVPLTPNSAVGQDWVSSDGKTLLEDLKAPYVDAASILAPTITSPGILAPLEVAFNPLADTNAIILGVSVTLDSKRLPTSQTAVNVSLKNGTDVSSVGDIGYASDNLSYSVTPVAQKAPDGTAWTQAKLAATSLVLKVKSSI
jgi:hypothetical protein